MNRVLTVTLMLCLAALCACGSGPDCARGDHGGAECRIATSATLATMEVDGFVLAFVEPRQLLDPLLI